MTNLYRVDSPINREQLNNLNLTFEDILSRFTNLQRQINILTGGEEVELILERIEETIIQAQTDIAESIRINDEALQIALNDIESQMTLINQAIESSESSTTEAVNAKNGALEATRSAIDAITEMRQLINNFNSRGIWNNETQYYKNNLVSLNGNTYIAIKDNVNKPVTDLTNWTLFAEKGIKGEKGETGAPGTDGKDGTGVNIVGSLTNESELPSSGETGDAYLINGNLFVWNGAGWEDAGNIKGPKGDKGDPGPAGSDANVTNENIINVLGYTPADNEEVTLLKSQVTIHESRLNQLEDSSNTVKADVSGLNREVAYLKLQQEASKRIEGGVVFGDDFKGNRFGITLNESESNNVTAVGGELNIGANMVTKFNFPETVLASGKSYTSGGSYTNSSRLTRTKNGYLVAVVYNSSDTRLELWALKDDNPWKQIGYASVNGLRSSATIVSVGNRVQLMFTYGSFGLSVNFDVETLYNYPTLINVQDNAYSSFIKNYVFTSGISDFDSISAFTDTKTNTVHMAWSQKISSHPSSFNIFYRNNNADSKVYGEREQVTTFNGSTVNAYQPSIVVKDGVPCIAYQLYGSTSTSSGAANNSGFRGINYTKRSLELEDKSVSFLSGWSGQSIFLQDSYAVKSPSMVMSEDGIIHLAFLVLNSSGYGSIWYVTSNDSVVFGVRHVLNVAGPQSNIDSTSITIDREGKIFGVAYGLVTASNSSYNSHYYRIEGTGVVTFNYYGSASTVLHPLYDQYFLTTFTLPPVIFGAGGNGLRFRGEWSDLNFRLFDSGKLVYDIPETNFVGMYLKNKGNLKVDDIKVNGESVEFRFLLNELEYKFTKALETVAPVKVEIEMSAGQNTTLGNNTLLRVLGGIA